MLDNLIVFQNPRSLVLLCPCIMIEPNELYYSHLRLFCGGIPTFTVQCQHIYRANLIRESTVRCIEMTTFIASGPTEALKKCLGLTKQRFHGLRLHGPSKVQVYENSEFLNSNGWQLLHVFWSAAKCKSIRRLFTRTIDFNLKLQNRHRLQAYKRPCH